MRPTDWRVRPGTCAALRRRAQEESKREAAIAVAISFNMAGGCQIAERGSISGPCRRFLVMSGSQNCFELADATVCRFCAMNDDCEAANHKNISEGVDNFEENEVERAHKV